MKKISIKENFIYSTFFQIFNVIIPFITAPYLSRVLGPESIGIQSYTSAIQGYFSLFAALGTATYGAREIARNRDNRKEYSRLFWEIELMTVITTGICLIVWFLFIVISQEYKVYYIVLTMSILATMFDISWFFSGLEQFKFLVLRNTGIKVLSIVCMFSFVKDSEDVVIYMVIVSLSSLLSSLVTWTYLPVYIEKVSIRSLKVLGHFRETIVYFIPTIATSVYTMLDKTLIGLITQDMSENGYYDQAGKIINIAKSVVFTAINSVVGVRISYLFAENKIEEIHRRIRNSMNYIIFAGVGCAFGLLAVSERFIPIFLGTGYEKVVTLLYIFSPVVLIIGISNCLGSHYYTPSGKRAQSAKYIIAGAVVNFFLNTILIPRLASYGAAIATVLAETLITILYVRFCDSYVTGRDLLIWGYKKVLAGITMFIIIVFLGKAVRGSEIFILALQVVTGIGIYIITLLVLKDDWIVETVSRHAKFKRRN